MCIFFYLSVSGERWRARTDPLMVLGGAKGVHTTGIRLRAGIPALRLDAHLVGLAVPVNQAGILLGLDAHVVLALEVSRAVRVHVTLLPATSKLVVVRIAVVTWWEDYSSKTNPIKTKFILAYRKDRYTVSDG